MCVGVGVGLEEMLLKIPAEIAEAQKGWKGPLGITQSNPWGEQGHLELAVGPCPVGFGRSLRLQGGWEVAPLGNLEPVAEHPRSKRCVLVSDQISQFFFFVVSSLVGLYSKEPEHLDVENLH